MPVERHNVHEVECVPLKVRGHDTGRVTDGTGAGARGADGVPGRHAAPPQTASHDRV